MITMTAILKMYFGSSSSSEQKGQLTRNLIGSIWMTCRSKIAKIILIGNPSSHVENLFFFVFVFFLLFFFFSEPKDQLTRNKIEIMVIYRFIDQK